MHGSAVVRCLLVLSPCVVAPDIITHTAVATYRATQFEYPAKYLNLGMCVALLLCSCADGEIDAIMDRLVEYDKPAAGWGASPRGIQPAPQIAPEPQPEPEMPVASVKSLVQAEQVEKRVSSSSSDDDELLLFKPATPQPAHPDTEREEQPAVMEPEPALDVAMKSEPDEMPTPEPDPEPEQREPMLEQLLESQVHPVAVPVPEPVPSPIPEPEQAATSLFAEPTHSAATVLPQRAFSDDGGSSIASAEEDSPSTTTASSEAGLDFRMPPRPSFDIHQPSHNAPDSDSTAQIVGEESSVQPAPWSTGGIDAAAGSDQTSTETKQEPAEPRRPMSPEPEMMAELGASSSEDSSGGSRKARSASVRSAHSSLTYC